MVGACEARLPRCPPQTDPLPIKAEASLEYRMRCSRFCTSKAELLGQHPTGTVTAGRCVAVLLGKVFKRFLWNAYNADRGGSHAQFSGGRHIHAVAVVAPGICWRCHFRSY